MKLIDRIIFGFIAVALCVLAVRAFMPVPVRATTGEVVKVDIVSIGGNPYAWLHLIQLITNK